MYHEKHYQFTIHLFNLADLKAVEKSTFLTTSKLNNEE